MSVNDPALLAALERLRSGRFKTSKIRAFDAVCQHQVRLAEVIQLDGHLVAVFQTVSTFETLHLDHVEETVQHRMQYYVQPLDGLELGAWFTAANRCCSRRIDVAWLTAQANSATPRGVVPKD